MSELTEPKAKTKLRSPSYPGVGLDKAVHYARKIYEREYRHPVAWEIAVRHLGLSSKSSAARVATAAMKKFGLIEVQGDEVRLTETAIDIIHPDPDQPHKVLETLKSAALRPGIYREIWEKYNQHLPTDDSIRYYLERNRGFNPSAVRSFIRDFRETIAYARLERSDSDDRTGTATGSPSNGFFEDEDDFLDDTPTATVSAGVSSPVPAPAQTPNGVPVAPASQLLLILPLRSGGTVDLRFTHRVSSEEFARILKMIEFSEPAFVEPDHQA